jgi:hypothetical protein
MARQQWARPGIGTAAFPLVTENPVSAGARNTVLGGFQLTQRTIANRTCKKGRHEGDPVK